MLKKIKKSTYFMKFLNKIFDFIKSILIVCSLAIFFLTLTNSFSILITTCAIQRCVCTLNNNYRQQHVRQKFIQIAMTCRRHLKFKLYVFKQRSFILSTIVVTTIICSQQRQINNEKNEQTHLTFFANTSSFEMKIFRCQKFFSTLSSIFETNNLNNF